MTLNPKLLFMLCLGMITFFARQLHAKDSEALTAREVVTQHVEAMGGLYAWQQVESIRIKGSIKRPDLIAKFCIIKKRPTNIRATLTIPMPNNPEEHMQIIQAYDGNSAWTATRLAGSKGVRPVELQGASAHRLTLDARVMPDLIHLSRSNDTKITLHGKTAINDQHTYVLHVTDKEGIEYTFYVSCENFQVVRLITDSKITGITQTDYNNYKEVEGVSVPTEYVIAPEKGQPSTLKIDGVTVGVGLYNEYFSHNDT